MLILELKTTQTHSIKILIDTLNSLLPDVNFVFYPNILESDNTESPKQAGGLIIKEINKTGTILVYVRLDAEKFDFYNYNYHKNKIVVGINLANLLKCLKCMSNYDTMSWAIDSDDINKLIIILESSERKEKKTFKLNLMDLEEEKYEVEPIDFPYSITLPSQDFHKYCKDMFSAAEKMEIICTSNKVMFSGNGELGPIEFEVSETNGGLTIETNQNCYDEIVQGLFELRSLIIFTKCTNLSPQVILYLMNDYPLIIQYSVAALGVVKFVLSQKDTKN